MLFSYLLKSQSTFFLQRSLNRPILPSQFVGRFIVSWASISKSSRWTATDLPGTLVIIPFDLIKFVSDQI